MSAPGEFGQYSRLRPEPIEVIESWGLNHHQATILAYLVRYPAKNGVEDLEKAAWYLDRLINLERARRDEPTYDTTERPDADTVRALRTRAP